jgi:hypothetical protein
MRFPVEISQSGSALNSDGAFGGLNMDGTHVRKVNYNTVIAKRAAADVVTTTPDCR